MPGVLLSEALFQTGALLMSGGEKKLAVVTRVKGTKFKRIVRPPATLTIYVSLVEQLDNAYYMKGKITLENQTVMSSEFTVALLKD